VALICVRAVERGALPLLTSGAVAPHMPAAVRALDLVVASSFASFVMAVRAEQHPSIDGAGPLGASAVGAAVAGGAAGSAAAALPGAAIGWGVAAGAGSSAALTGATAVADGMAKTTGSSSFLPQPTIAAAMRTMETSENERRAEVDMTRVYSFFKRAARDRRVA
jgi:hypothetical protein